MAVLLAKLAEYVERFKDNLFNSKQRVVKNLGESDPGRTALSTAFMFQSSLVISTNKILLGDNSGWRDLQQTFSYMKWAMDLLAHEYDREVHDYARGTLMDDEVTFYYLLARATAGADDWASPSARLLYNAMLEGGYMATWDSGSTSSPLDELVFRLAVIDLKNEWRDLVDDEYWGDDDLGGFKRLLGSVGTPDFKAALLEYCDFRMARSLGYASLSALRPSPPNRETSFEFDNVYFALFPLELLALKSVYERTTGQTLSLDADHPLLKTPLMEIPKSFTLIEDDITRSMQAVGEKVFGSMWKPGSAPQIIKIS